MLAPGPGAKSRYSVRMLLPEIRHFIAGQSSAARDGWCLQAQARVIALLRVSIRVLVEN